MRDPEYDAIDSLLGRIAREEEDDIARESGQFLLSVVNATKEQGSAALLQLLDRAHKAAMKAEGEDESEEEEPDGS